MSLGKTDYTRFKNHRIGGTKKTDKIFRPRLGGADSKKFTIRLLPPVFGEDLPLYDTDIHYFEGNKIKVAGVCPRRLGAESCPACHMFFSLRTHFPEKSTENNVVRSLRPNTRVYANVVERFPETPEVEKIQVWSMTFSSGEKIQDTLGALAEDNVFVDDPEEGRDLVLTFKKQGWGAMLDLITAKPKESSLGIEDPEPINLREFAHQKEFTVEEIEELLPKILGEYYPEFVEIMESEESE